MSNHVEALHDMEQVKERNPIPPPIPPAKPLRYTQNVPRKSLPDSVIQTITQRVQTLGIGTDRRWSFDNPNNMTRLLANEMNVNTSSAQSNNPNENEDKILSVSGKKKCSHCNNELGRGAAMVIET
ncbi:hypothetical protein pipiens_008204 [Culex pipiens pipiens]|uniref:Uncharacterized protein n=1 Tax=Culex pipiens pipiens TaxID=38569 RepID=A0ABD1DIN2_CULPP